MYEEGRTTGQTSPYSGRPIIDWYDETLQLKDVDGDKVGDILEVNADFVVVETSGGFLGLGERQRYFIPRTSISRQDGGDWYLAIDRDRLADMDWSQPPVGSRYGAEDWQQDQAQATDQYARTRLVRWEEDLEAEKVSRQAGEVSVRKEVVEDTRTVEVSVRREEVHVERRPVTDASLTGSDGTQAFTGAEEEIRVPVMEEDVEVRKVARPVEEVVVSKTTGQDTRRVSDTVRREEFDIEDDTLTSDVGSERGTTR